MKSVFLSILGIMICFAAQAIETAAPQIGSHIVITKPTKVRTASFFAGTTYLKGALNSGDIGQVLNVDLNKKSGIGVYVKVVKGKSVGSTGWVYYHKAESSRTMTLHNSAGKEIELDYNEVAPAFKGIRDYLKNNTADFVDATTVLPSKYKVVETEDEIWNNIYDGKYQVASADPIEGTMKVIKPMKRSDGTVEKVKLTLPYSFEKLLSIPKNASTHESSGEEDCSDDDKSELYKDYTFLKGCEALKKSNLTDDYDSLAVCMKSIKKAITKGGVTNANVKKNLYKLNPLEQEFAAMTLTAYGESGVLAPPLREMVIVMKTLENRAEYAQKKGFPKANALDAAIQKHQYSMWTNGYKNKKTGKFQYEQWKSAVTASEHNNNTVNSIKSFILYKKSKFGPSKSIDNIYHYHTNYVNPNWKDKKRIVDVTVNGKGLKKKGTRHIFYRNIPWTFAYTKYKPKDQK